MNADSGARWSAVGAVAAAGTVAATILCCLPFAAGIAGAGLAAIGARFAPVRPYLTAISLGCLGYAFYLTYQHRAVTCTPDGCEVQGRSRVRTVAVWIVAVLVVTLLTAPWWASWVIYWTL